jgi:hypothetical protein
MLRLAAMAFALVSTTAAAAPVYLRCQFDPALDESRRPPMDVTLNESESTVSWAFANIDRVMSGKATFSAESVLFNRSDIGGFTIDRTNLMLRERKMNIPTQPITAQTDFTYRSVAVGTCEVVNVKTAF